jgi:hypothetical protein
MRVVQASGRQLAYDVVELADLQLRLFAADGQECARRITPPVLMMVVGLVIVLGGLPLALVGLAYALVDLAGLPVWIAILCSVTAGSLLGTALIVAGARRAGPQLAIWQRSTGELRENIQWLKAALQRPPASRSSHTTRPIAEAKSSWRETPGG